MEEKKMDLDICLRCMTPLNGVKVCPHCHLEAGSYVPEKHHLAPRTILDGKYLVGCVLGEGGFGITYIGWDLQLHTMVAIKEYFPTGIVFRDNSVSNILTIYSGNSEKTFLYDRDKFMREAQMLAKFGGNPGVVDVKNYFKENGTAYIVMEYVQGINLSAYTEQNGGKLPIGQVLKLLETPIKTLGEMHQARTYHRDLSPENMMVTENGTVKLIDFGSTMTIQKNKSTTTLKVRAGYSPIELYTMSGQEGPFSDIYALSATIYRTITGVTPPAATDRIDTDQLIPPIKAGAKGLTPAQEQALMKGLSVKAQDRFQRVEDLYAALVAGDQGKKKLSWKQVSGITAACLVLVGAGIWKLSDSSKPLEPILITEESFHGDTERYTSFQQGDYTDISVSLSPEELRIEDYLGYISQIASQDQQKPQKLRSNLLQAYLDGLEQSEYWPYLGNLLIVNADIESLIPFQRHYESGLICLEFHNCVLPKDLSPLKSMAPSLVEFSGRDNTLFTCDTIDWLEASTNLQVLDMTFAPGSKADLSVLKNFTQLRILRLRNVAISEADLAEWIPSWQNLETLQLNNTGITDESLFNQLPALQNIIVHNEEEAS
ncbi:MAG: protein kinase [Clostridia bacterium]|nr:protein kinase [Clostridia bacterium]